MSGSIKLCVNGCNKPICAPSKVICRDCMDRITRNLEKFARGDFDSYEPKGRNHERDD